MSYHLALGFRHRAGCNGEERRASSGGVIGRDRWGFIDGDREDSFVKVKSSIKRRTKDCQIVIRKGRRFVINKKNPRLKQRQG